MQATTIINGFEEHSKPLIADPVPLKHAKRTLGKAERLVLKVADMVAWMVSKRRKLVHLNLSEGECDQDGLTHGSTERAVYVRQHGNPAPLWHLAVYLDHQHLGSEDDCVGVRLLGFEVEVWCRPRGPVVAA